jgi:hypothetical protein
MGFILNYNENKKIISLAEFLTQERNQTVKISVKDFKGGEMDYSLKLFFRCNETTPATLAEQ